MMKKIIIFTPLLIAAVFAAASATIINIPDDYATIQQGINASSDGDTVMVQPGTYNELVNFNGKNVTVASLFLTTDDMSYISSTIIDGNSAGTVVLFESGENQTAALIGFTITGGNGSFGGGISCASYSSPSIIYNDIEQNYTSQGGGGISCWQGCNPLISHNVIHDNSAVSYGGGILCSTGCNPTVTHNVFSGNVSSSDGGGLMSWQSNPVVVNSIFWNDSGVGNNEISGTVSVTYCDVDGGWAGEGNIDCDPMFCDPGNDDFHLDSGSCCIGAGEGGADIGAYGVGCGLEIPTLSQWGLLILALLMLSMGTVSVVRGGRRSPVADTI